MALMLGVRVASYCLGGAAVIITHEATKTTTEKLSHWLNANKHNLRHPWRWSRSPDLNPEPNHGVNEPDDAANEPEAPVEEGPFPYHSVDSADGAPVCELRAGPKVPESAVTGGDLTLGPSVLTAVNDTDDAVKKPFLYGAVDSGDGAPTCEPRAKPNVPESAATGGDPMGGPSVLTAVIKEAGSADNPDLVPAANAVSSGSVPGPDRSDDANPSFGAAAADGIRGFLSKAVNAVRTWGMKLLRWFPVDGVCNSKGAPGDTGWTVDPDFWDKIGRIRKKILLWAVEYVILERAMKHNKVWRQLYNIVKIELKFTTL